MHTRVAMAWLAAVAVMVGLLGAARSAEAATTRTWTGNGATNNWTDAGNWSAGAPVAGDRLVFPPSANRKANVNNFAANTSFDQIRLDGAGYTLSGNPVSITDAVFADPGTGTNTIDLAINGPGAIDNQSGKLILSGNNDFTDAVEVDSGILVALSDHALGRGGASGSTFVDSDAVLLFSGGVDSPETVEAQGAGPGNAGVVQSSDGVNRLAVLKLTGPATVGVNGGTLILDLLTTSGPGAGLTLVGGGKLQVESSFLAGEVDVIDGNLTWNAASQVFVTVEPDGLLRGTGTVSQVTVAGGMVWPGSGNFPAVLSVFTNTTFNAGTFRVDIDGLGAGTGYGQLQTDGLSLNPVSTLLDLDVSTTPSTGDVYRIVDNTSGTPVQGTFLGLPEASTFVEHGFVWQISYKGGTGNDVTLTVLRVASADLQLQLSALPSPVATGGTLTYTIVVTNNGPDTASSPTVSLGTPVGTSYLTATKPANWTCANPSPSPTVSCTGPKLPAGEFVTITLSFKVNATSGSISATAGVSSATNDPASGNNSAILSTSLGAADNRPFKRVVVGLARD